MTMTYGTAHTRVAKARGPASDHLCECGERAEQWAYQGGAANELAHPRDGKPYSDDISDYEPMCKPCHKDLDGTDHKGREKRAHGRTLLDLFCGAGGATKGYQDAGFTVTGVDIAPQPRYVGEEFVQADAMEYLASNWWRYDAIHASPPCQRYSKMTRCRPGLADQYPDLVPKLSAWLDYYAKPYIIENVPEAPLRDPLVLCGSMFGYELYRHRAFQTNFRTKPPKHPFHHKSAVHPDNWHPGLIMSVVGNCAPIEHARKIMAIDWMLRDELAEAIPPYYTEYIGDFLRRRLDRLARG